jgi:hypothetical protein
LYVQPVHQPQPQIAKVADDQIQPEAHFVGADSMSSNVAIGAVASVREIGFSEQELSGIAANVFRYCFRKTGAETTSLA